MHSIWRDSLIVPVYVSAASAVILFLNAAFLSKPIKWLYSRLIPNSKPNGTELFIPEQDHPAGRVQQRITSHGSAIVFAHNVVRLIGCLALLGLSISTLISEEKLLTDKLFFVMTRKHADDGYRKHEHSTNGGYSETAQLQVASSMTTVHESIYKCNNCD